MGEYDPLFPVPRREGVLPMGERWKVAVCPVHGPVQIGLTAQDGRHPVCPVGLGHEREATIGYVEVVPASDLKRCEEEWDEARRELARRTEVRFDLEKQYVTKGQRDAEAQCERLEGALEKIRDFDDPTKQGTVRVAAMEEIAEAALSTPKTEGEPPIHPDLLERERLDSPDPIGRDVRGYEK